MAAQHADARTVAKSQHTFYAPAAVITGVPLNFYNLKGMTRWGPLMTMGYLGVLKFSSNPFSFIPGIASKWKVSKNGKQVTVTINSKARWSDGKPITARDLYVSTQIAFVRSAVQAYGFESPLKTVNSHTVIFKQRSDNTYNLFLRQVLSQVVAPASQYAALLPADVNQTIADSEYTGNDPSLVAKAKAAVASLSALSKKIDAYDPPKDLSDGPYVISVKSPSEVVLVKNKYFYDAKKIHVNKVVVLNDNDDNQTDWNYALGNKVQQMTSGGMTSDLINNIKRVPGMRFYKVPSTASLQLVFNESFPPYDNVKVRQALAYAIDRNSIWKVAARTGGSPSQYITGTVDSNAKAFLTKDQLKRLNPYKKDLKKATALLQSAGFKKQDGKWHLPNGDLWNMTLYTVSGFNDVVEAFQNISSQLTSFGIQAQPQLVPNYGQYLDDLGHQKYAVGFYIGTSPIPYTFMARLYGASDGYQVEGGQLIHYTNQVKDKGNWLNFPITVTMKGYGKVQVGPLTYKLSQLRDAKKIRALVQELLITTNYYVPEITMWNVIQTGFANDRYFSSYPLKNVAIMRSCSGYYPPVGCWQLFGYVQPK
ncbi:MAG: hypothetical protein NVS2B16_28560 [Chloroflexota bacterium]